MSFECDPQTGHDWQPAAGGMLICAACEATKWGDEHDAPPSVGDGTREEVAGDA